MLIYSILLTLLDPLFNKWDSRYNLKWWMNPLKSDISIFAVFSSNEHACSNWVGTRPGSFTFWYTFCFQKVILLVHSLAISHFPAKLIMWPTSFKDSTIRKQLWILKVSMWFGTLIRHIISAIIFWKEFRSEAVLAVWQAAWEKLFIYLCRRL